MTDKLGRYELLQKIATGGMAEIYRARLCGAAGFTKDFALKKILPFWSDNPEFITMLVDEANILTHLHHDNIVQVFELSEANGQYFLVMEYVDGTDLKTLLDHLRMNGQKLSDPIIHYILRKVCLALEYAHARNDARGTPLQLVHRDVSPHNILISRDGGIKLADFGIAKLSGKSNRTRTGILKGKFSYMSPEQASGQSIDARSDIFSLGVTLHEMLCGEKPFTGENDFEILAKIKDAVLSITPAAHRHFQPILIKCLQKAKPDRFASAHELLTTLEKLSPCLGDATESQVQKRLAELLKSMLPAKIDPGSHQDVTRRAGSFADLPNNALESTATLTHQHAVTELTCEATAVHESTVPDHDLTSSELLTIDDHVHTVTTPTNTPAIADNAVRPHSQSAFRNYFSTLMQFASVLMIVIGTVIATFPAPQQKKLQTAVPGTSKMLPAQFTKPPLATRRLTDEQKYAPLKIKNRLGRILFESEPRDARITATLDGKEHTGTGWLKRNFVILDEKRITVTVSSPGYQTRSLDYTLTSEKPEVMEKISLVKTGFGTLRIDARPWGIASVKGFGSRETPGSFRLPEGKHTVTVWYPPEGKSVSRTLEIKSDSAVQCRGGFSDKRFLTCS